MVPRFARTLAGQFFLAIVLIGVLPLGGLGLGFAALEHRALADEAAGELVGLARGLAAELDVYLYLQLSESRAVASLPQIVSMDPVQQEPILSEIFHHFTELTRLSTFDLDGRRVASSGPGGASDVSAQPAFQEAVRRAQQVWDVSPAVSTGRPSFIVHTPIRNPDRRVVGILRAIVDLETISGTLERVPVGGGRRAFALDAQGRVVAHPDSAVVADRRTHTALGLPTRGRVPGPGSITYDAPSERVVAGFAPVPSAGWTVYVERAEAEVLAPAHRTLRLSVVGLLGSMCLSLVAAALLTRRLTRPVRQLATAARAIGAGDLAAPLPAPRAASEEVNVLIAAFREMEQRLAARREERARLLAQEQTARAAAEGALRAREEFLSVAAHELKTPMTSLLVAAQMALRRLDRGPLDPDRVRHALTLIDSQASKLARLTDQLLDVSRLEAGRLALDPRPTDLRALVRGAAAAARLRTTTHHVTVQTPDHPLVLAADPLRLEQVLTNLLENAMKYSPSGGAIDLTLDGPAAAPDAAVHNGHGGVVRFAVRDYGLGIPEEHRERIFDRFHQAHTSDHVSGMGLGLYISRQIVELHGGRIWAEFPADGGTRFVVELPAFPEATIPTDPTVGLTSVPAARGAARGPGRRGTAAQRESHHT